MVIASGVEAIFEEEAAVRIFFCFASYKESVLLFGYYIRDVASFGLEIIFHPFRLVFITTLLKHRIPLKFTYRVDYSGCIDSGAVEFHADFRGVKFELTIVHISISVKISVVLPCEHEGVFCREIDYIVYVNFLTDNL